MPDTFDFLGFTHICAKSCPMKHFIVRRKTAAKRLRAKLKEVKDLLRRKLHEPVPQVGAWHGSVVRGHMNYYAVPGNINSVDAFRTQVARLWLRTLRRRSQRHRLTWSRFCQSFDHFLPRSRILHHYPNDRFCAIHSKKEPSAVVPLAGICAGGSRATGIPTANIDASGPAADMEERVRISASQHFPFNHAEVMLFTRKIVSSE